MAGKTVAFMLLSRPHFLLGGVLLFALGARTSPELGLSSYLVAQLMVTSTQLTAHYVNEYADAAADRAVVHRTAFSGGSGMIPSGRVQRRTALTAAYITTGVASGAAIAVAFDSPGAAAAGIAALAIAWAYSMPPARLLGTGWGEVATSLVVTALVPLVGALSQGAVVGAFLAWSVATLFPIHMAMMLAFELPDLLTDRAAAKRVLAVRIGPAATVRLIRVLLAGAATVGIAGWAAGAIPSGAAAVAAVAALPAGATAYLAPRPMAGRLTTSAVATLVVAAVGLLLGAAPAQAH